MQRWHGLSHSTQQKLDAHFRKVHKQGRAGFSESHTYARLVILGSFSRLEVHIAAVVIMLLAMSTSIFIPFGTADWPTRISLISVAMLLGTGMSFFLLYLYLIFHMWKGVSLWAIAAAHAVTISIAFCLIEPLIILNFQDYPVPTFASIFPAIFLLYALTDIFVLWHIKPLICFRHHKNAHNTAQLKTLIPAQKQGDILLMSAADHYVEIVTKNGSHLHRMTMKTAIEKAECCTGMQVHRSHWVAYSAMFSLEKTGERYFLLLRGGQKVPVSPAHAANVRQRLGNNRQAAE